MHQASSPYAFPESLHLRLRHWCLSLCKDCGRYMFSRIYVAALLYWSLNQLDASPVV